MRPSMVSLSKPRDAHRENRRGRREQEERQAPSTTKAYTISEELIFFGADSEAKAELRRRTESH